MTLSIAQAEDELRVAKQRLRDALIRVQTYRINAVLDAETPDILSEITWLVQAGRHQAAALILNLADEYISANVNYQYVNSTEGHAYAAAINPDDAPDYLKGS